MSRIEAPATPIRELGWLPAYASRPMLPASIHAPKVPLNQLGWIGASGAQVLSLTAPGAVIGGSAIATAAGAGAWAGPIGAGVGVIVGVIVSLWAAHAARAAGAKNENQAVSSAVKAFDASLAAIFQAANSGQLSPQDAVSACQQNLDLYWQHMQPYQSGPGRSDSSHGGTMCPPKADTSSKACTAGCFVGCYDLAPATANAIAVFQAGGGVAHVPTVFGDKYGLAQRSSYTLTYTPPAGVGGAVSSIESALTGGSGGSILPLLLVGIAAFLVLK